MKKNILIVCLILGLGTTLFLSLRSAYRFFEPEEQQGTGILSMRDSIPVLTIQADRGVKKNSSNTVYLFTCDRESNRIKCQLSRNNKHGRLRLSWHDSNGNRLLSCVYLAGQSNDENFYFGTKAGKFMPGDKITIRVIEQWLSGHYKLEVSQAKIP